MWSYTRSCPHACEQCSALRGSGAWQGGTEGWWGWGAHLACAPSGSGSAEARPPFHSAAGRQTRCRLSSPEAQAPRAHSPLGSCPRAGAGKSAEEAGYDGVKHRSLTWAPAPTAPAKAVERLGGCELLEGRSGEPPLRAQRPPRPTQDAVGRAHPLFLAGHKGLEAWGHAESQLVDVGWLLLAVDLHSNARFK